MGKARTGRARGLEAKFVSETAPKVGKRTFLGVLHVDGYFDWLLTADVRSIRELWESKGKPKVPDGAEELIADAIRRSREYDNKDNESVK